MPTTDNDILNAIKSDKETGFALLVRTYTTPIYWNVRRLIESFHDTEDVTQEIFLRIYKSIDSYRGDSSLKSWIYHISINEALRFLEKKNREKGLFSLGIDNVTPPIADEYINIEDVKAIKFQQAIDTLPPKQRAIFNLRYYDELNYDEIANILDISASSAKASFHVAKEKIKTYLIN